MRTKLSGRTQRLLFIYIFGCLTFCPSAGADAGRTRSKCRRIIGAWIDVALVAGVDDGNRTRKLCITLVSALTRPLVC